LGVFLEGVPMRKQLVAVSARQTAKVIALLWFAFTLPFVAIMCIAISFSSAPQKPPIGFLFLMPVLYAVFGYLFTLFGAWLYNLVAKYTGGIEFTTIQVEDAQQGVPADRPRPAGSAGG
jgi:hypothetical protein